MILRALKDKIDIAPLFGFALGGLCVVTVLLGEGRKLGAFVSLDAFAVVVGGSLGAALIVLQSRDLRVIASIVSGLLGRCEDPRPEIAKLFTKFVSTQRRHGVLEVERHLQEVKEGPLKAAVQQFVDGTDTEVILKILETEKERISRRGEVASVFFENLGGFAPTFGIVGTVISLVSVLSHLNEPQLLAQGVAEAFIATLYGVLFANLVFLPLSMRVTGLTKFRMETIDMIATGITAMCNEEHPVLLIERLRVFLPRESP